VRREVDFYHRPIKTDIMPGVSLQIIHFYGLSPERRHQPSMIEVCLFFIL